MAASPDNADQGWDSYNERVLRNEGRLEGLEQLVRETRAADRELVNQRADSLAKELTEKATALQSLMAEQREADAEQFHREIEALAKLNEAFRTEYLRNGEMALVLLREVYDTAIFKNYEQSNEQIKALDERSKARWASMEQQVTQWRDSDREARDLQASEYARRLMELNGEHHRIAAILAGSVTQEIFNQTIQTLGDKISVLDRAILLMPTNQSLAATIAGLSDRLDQSSRTLSDSSAARMDVLNEKLGDQKDRIIKIEQAVATTKENKGVNMTQFSAAIAALGFALTVIVLLANGTLFGN